MRGDVWSLIGMLAVVVLILFLAHWATRWIGIYGMRGSSGGGRMAGGEFCVLRQLSLGRNERLLLVRLQDQCYLLGVTAEQITMIKELEGDQAERWLSGQEDAAASPGFMEVLKENLRKRK